MKKLKIKTTESPVIRKVTQKLKEISEAQASLAALRDQNRKLFEQLHDLEHTVVDNTNHIKALLKEEAGKLKHGTHTLASVAGLKVTCTRSNSLDGNKLAKLAPKILKLGKYRLSITQEEKDRLLAAGVVTEDQVKQCSSLESRISVKPAEE